MVPSEKRYVKLALKTFPKLDASVTNDDEEESEEDDFDNVKHSFPTTVTDDRAKYPLDA